MAAQVQPGYRRLQAHGTRRFLCPISTRNRASQLSRSSCQSTSAIASVRPPGQDMATAQPAAGSAKVMLGRIDIQGSQAGCSLIHRALC
jgi:hypothetical protein